MNEIVPSDETVFSFEEFKLKNGQYYWLASDLMQFLGYDDMKSFSRVLQRAQRAMLALGINTFDNFVQSPREVDGETVEDYKLTRFACYLTAMNANPKKEQVARVQTYFILMTRQFELYLQNPEHVDRITIRDEMKIEQTSLASTVKRAGVDNYANFQNAGYLGMYNMMNVELARRRGLKPGELLDHMSKVELSANLFRITMTEEYIKTQDIRGQDRLENAHYEVGRKVRKTVREITGKNPEQLPIEKRIPEVQKELK